MPVSAGNSDTFQVTTPSDGEIRMTRLFDAPRHLVFEAMSKPEHITQWWGRLGEGPLRRLLAPLRARRTRCVSSVFDGWLTGWGPGGAGAGAQPPTPISREMPPVDVPRAGVDQGRSGSAGRTGADAIRARRCCRRGIEDRAPSAVLPASADVRLHHRAIPRVAVAPPAAGPLPLSGLDRIGAVAWPAPADLTLDDRSGRRLRDLIAI